MNEPTRASSIAGAWGIFVAVSVLPIALMLVGSFISPTGGWTLASYSGVLGDARQWQLLSTSVLIATGAALVAGLIGTPFGLVLARGDLRRPGVWRLLLAAPLLIPPYVMALAWVLGVGPTGPLAALVPPARLSDWAYSATSVAWVLGLCLFPLVGLGTEAALRQVNARCEDAARLVAPPLRVFRRVTLPLVAPTLAATLLVVFALALTEFGVPGLLRVRVFTTEVFTAFSAFFDFSLAAALSTPLLALTLLVMGAAIRATRFASLSARRVATPPVPASHLARRLGVAVLATIGISTVLLPLTLLAVDAWEGQRGLTDLSRATSPIATSVAVAGVAATIVATVSSVLGYARARAQQAGWMIDLTCAWLFAVPSTVMGIGLVHLWNRAGIETLYGTPGMLVVASVARFLPLGVLLVGAVGRQISGATEEAAVMSGARWPRRWLRVWLPQVRSAVAAVWGITFVLAFGELGASVLVVPPGTMTLPVHVYTMVANAPPGQLASLALIQAVAGLAGLSIAAVAWRRRPAW